MPAVLRCLGIPTRLITNYNSAHDNTGNLKTDLIFNSDGTPDRRNTRDSIWLVPAPFHKYSTPVSSTRPRHRVQHREYSSVFLLPLSVGTTTAGTR